MCLPKELGPRKAELTRLEACFMRCLLTLAVVMTSTAGLAAPQLAGPQEAKQGGDIFAANKKLGRGINLRNALEAPKKGDGGATPKPESFKAIKRAGFDPVRLPVKWSAHAQATAPYQL